MKSQYVIFFISTLLCGLYAQTTKFVFEFFRHGVSSPKQLDYENKDMFKEKWFGRSKITAIGMKQHYSMGQILRKHYILKNNLLSNKFKREEIKILSLDKSQNILTAYSHLLGLFPTGAGPEIEKLSMKETLPNYDLYNSEEIISKMRFESLPSQADVFPIINFPPENHYFGLTNEDVCAGVMPNILKNRQKPEVVDFIKNFRANYTLPLSNALKLDSTFFNDYKNISNLCNAFVAGMNDKRRFNSLNSVVQDGSLSLEKLYKSCQDFKLLDLFTVKLGDEKRELVRIASSKIVNKLIRHLDDVINAEYNNKTSPLKMIMYSAHERDIGAFFAYLKIALNTEVFWPKHSSSIIIELVKNSKAPLYNADDGDYAVNVFYDGKTLKNLRYKYFKTLILSQTVQDKVVNDFCGFTDYSYLLFIMAALLLFSMFIGFGVWIFIMFTRMKKKDENEEVIVENKQDDENQIRKELINNEEVPDK
jgi:hypothetical protein